MNCVVLLGRLTKDPELKTTNSGKSVTTFSLAVDRAYKQDNQPTADFFDVTAWGKQAEVICQYLKKGRQICVRGRLQQRKWQTRTGENRYAVDVVLESFDFVGSSKDASGGSGSSGSAPASQRDDSLDFDDDFSLLAEDDDMPF